jgi:N6-adenosine-specific RNA methylase IME4
MRAWGFRVVTKAFCWVKVDKTGKPRKLPGHYGASNTEDCWLGIRGRMLDKLKTKMVSQTIFAEVGEHSAKPEETRKRIELMFDGPRAELFAREKASDWDAYGYEIDNRDIREVLAA